MRQVDYTNSTNPTRDGVKYFLNKGWQILSISTVGVQLIYHFVKLEGNT